VACTLVQDQPLDNGYYLIAGIIATSEISMKVSAIRYSPVISDRLFLRKGSGQEPMAYIDTILFLIANLSRSTVVLIPSFCII
jgi:hypothetical protein